MIKKVQRGGGLLRPSQYKTVQEDSRMILLVVDTQKGITDERLHHFEQFRDNIKTLIFEARENGVEVVYVRHDDGPGTGFSVGDDEFAIFEEFAPRKGERIFDKTVNSALHESTGLATYLSEKEEKQIMVVGLQTDFCIDATIKSGFDLGYQMIVPAYANSTFDNAYIKKEVSYHYYNEFIWPKRYAKCVSMKEAAALLRGVVRVAAAIICDDMKAPSKIFATAKGYGEFQGKWEFPGGKIEVGEQPEDALRREVREELDTEILVGDFITTIEYDYPAFHLSMDCFLAQVKKGSLVLREAKESRWLAKNELYEVAWLPADLSLIEMIEKRM